jgi:hypothetical protein
MSDRLEKIKLYASESSLPSTEQDHYDWLISEVTRLRSTLAESLKVMEQCLYESNVIWPALATELSKQICSTRKLIKEKK